jgi:glycosyltransferase involved in cell wall biosynthesis
MTKTIYIVALESVPTRYTCQWLEGLPKAIEEFAKDAGKDVRVVNVVGADDEQIVTPGAFLNFAGTNVWKSQQAIEISKLFASGDIKAGDKILFTDAWNPTIIQVKYMSELLNIPVELHGIWHAGSYDPQDFLGRLIDDKRWSKSTERAIFHALDYNIFATDFHIKLFLDGVFIDDNAEDELSANDVAYKVVKSGQPHETLMLNLEPYMGKPKRNLILFPHRVAPEKQPLIFQDLAKELPEYEFVICQDQKLSKDEYHDLLGAAKIVFSANLQETLGISAMEGVLVDAMPLVPDRLSYEEMYLEAFKYPSEWTTDYNAYLRHKNDLIARIRDMMDNYDLYRDSLMVQDAALRHRYMTGTVMYKKLLK